MFYGTYEKQIYEQTDVIDILNGLTYQTKEFLVNV